MRNHIRLAIVITILSVAVFSQAGVDELTQIVPAGAPMVVYIADVPASIDQWEASPLARLWNDPQVRLFFAPLREELEVRRWDDLVRAETGYGIDELNAMITGDLVVFVESFEVSLEDGAEDADFDIAVAVTVGDNATKLERMILEQEAKHAEKAAAKNTDEEEETTKETREFKGIDLHVDVLSMGDDDTVETAWAVVDGVLAIGSPVESLERVVTRILDGGLDTDVRSGENFATVSSHTRKANSWFFMDMEPWMPTIRTAIDQALSGAEAAGSPFPLDSAALITALGLEALQTVFATCDFDEQTMIMDFGSTYTEDRGLVKLLAYGPEKAPRPSYIPLDSDGFSTGHFDFAGAWATVVDIVNGVNPTLMGLASMQLQSTAQQAGVELDLKRDLLDNLTGEIVTVQNFGGITGESLTDIEVEQDQVFAIGIRRQEALENVISGIKAMAGGAAELFTDHDFEGHTIFALTSPQYGDEPVDEHGGYTITDGHLLVSIGPTSAIESVLTQMDSEDTSIWDQPLVRRAVDVLPSGPNAIQWQNVASVGDLVFHGIAIAEGIQVTEDGDDFNLCNPEAIPDSGTVGKYIESAVNGVWKDDRELLMRVWILPAAGE